MSAIDDGCLQRRELMPGIDDGCLKRREHISTIVLVNIWEWRGFESRWFCRSGLEFAKTQLSILNH